MIFFAVNNNIYVPYNLQSNEQNTHWFNAVVSEANFEGFVAFEVKFCLIHFNKLQVGHLS